MKHESEKYTKVLLTQGIANDITSVISKENYKEMKVKEREREREEQQIQVTNDLLDLFRFRHK